jgi:hypothetical protein
VSTAARRTVPLERDEQARVVSWFHQAHRAYRGCLSASGNGLHIGGNTARQKAAHWASFMRQGGQPGFSDLFLMVPRGPYAGLFIEMKRADGTRGDVSDDEFLHIGLALRMGYQATWCAGAAEAIGVINDYLAQIGGE